MIEYPEHEKVAKVKDQSQAIGAFLDAGGLGEGIVLARWEGRQGDYLDPVHLNIEKVLAKYFGIDLDKLEAEKIQMLEELRKSNAPTHQTV